MRKLSLILVIAVGLIAPRVQAQDCFVPETVDGSAVDASTDSVSECATFPESEIEDVCSSPQWYARAEALFLHRSNSATNQVLAVSSATGDPLLFAHDLKFDMVAGPSVLVGRSIDACSAVELSYFGTHNWDTSATVVAINDVDLPGVIVGAANDFDNADSMIFAYASEMHNAEFNYVSCCNGISFLSGFRYVNWEEEFNINATDNDGDVSDYNVRSKNNLYGGQVGARVIHGVDCLCWELTGKAGLFGNDSKQRQTLLDNGNTVVLRDTGAEDSSLAFVGDINISVALAISESVSIRCGYNAMLITDLALASDQLDFTDDALSGTALNLGGDVFLHGANVGLEARW